MRPQAGADKKQAKPRETDEERIAREAKERAERIRHREAMRVYAQLPAEQQVAIDARCREAGLIAGRASPYPEAPEASWWTGGQFWAVVRDRQKTYFRWLMDERFGAEISRMVWAIERGEVAEAQPPVPSAVAQVAGAWGVERERAWEVGRE